MAAARRMTNACALSSRGSTPPTATAFLALIARSVSPLASRGRAASEKRFPDASLTSPPLFSSGSCPLGAAYDSISNQVPKISDMSFKSATGASSAKLNALFIPSTSLSQRSDRQIIVQIMTTEASPSAPYGTFAWRYTDDDYFSPEQQISLYMSATTPYPLTGSGVFVYWDPVKDDTESFETSAGQIAAGDLYEFSISQEFVNGEVGIFDSSDSNTMHQLVECSGRGLCDTAAGKCSCLPGYSGEACQRSESRKCVRALERQSADVLTCHLSTPHPPLNSDVPEPVLWPRLMPDAAPFCSLGQPRERCGLLWLRARPAVRLQVRRGIPRPGLLAD